ncbi:MAG: Sugar transporter SemiSWEET [Syntrophomonadaceae bacterium]|nr:Sugar transporter SemiSWEET [Bacillota bacterium]
MIGFHHLRSRALATQGLEPFPAKGAFKRFIDYLMYGVGVLAPLALLPQILQIYTTKSSAGLSLSTWLLLAVFNVLWALYGAMHKDKHIFFASILMMCFNSVIVVGILLY